MVADSYISAIPENIIRQMSTTHPKAAFTELLRDLVRIETENPPGNEGPCAEYIGNWFEERGIEATIVDEPDPDRPQVAARIGTGAPTVVLNGHLDVVPAGDRSQWEYDPYGGTVEDDRLYGRGSTDMKAGIALAMLAAERLKEPLESGSLDGSLIVHGAMGEETAEPGTRALLEAGFDGEYGIVLEPTEFKVATSEKGLAWYEIEVGGVPTHASRPDQGSNAVLHGQHVVDALEEYDQRVRERTDDLVGQAYATITQFVAGEASNKGVLPDRAMIALDRRYLPEETATGLDDELDSLLDAVSSRYDLDISWTRTQTYESAAVPVDCHLARVFREHSSDVADAPTEPWGTKASSDVRNLINDAGMEAIVWGPGSNDQAHIRDEFIDLKWAESGLEILERAIRELMDDE
jgi:succinyl-diaminopimelate desuccinylase